MRKLTNRLLVAVLIGIGSVATAATPTESQTITTRPSLSQIATKVQLGNTIWVWVGPAQFEYPDAIEVQAPSDYGSGIWKCYLGTNGPEMARYVPVIPSTAATATVYRTQPECVTGNCPRVAVPNTYKIR